MSENQWTEQVSVKFVTEDAAGGDEVFDLGAGHTIRGLREFCNWLDEMLSSTADEAKGHV